MAANVSEISRIRRKVFTEVAKLALQNRLTEEIDGLPRKLTSEGLKGYRCCEFKERAILAQRIKLAIGANLAEVKEVERLEKIAEKVLAENEIILAKEEEEDNKHIVNLIEEACERCPIDRIVVTNACRNCVAHHCVNTCPRDAIEIMGNRAYINQEQCVECGLCVKACPYGAILDIERPCSRACAVDALVPGENSTATIDYEKCVECGACISACPFGALSYSSDIIKVIQMLQSPARVVALVAPAFVGQFGPMANWSSVEIGLNKIGFAGVVPVAFGADLTIEEEGKEVVERFRKGEELIFNSCCPSFKNLINKHFAEIAARVSHTPSPMLLVARWLREKEEGEDIKLVFVGPCVSKKGEALREGKGLVDAVLTFEELTSIFVAANINLARLRGGEDEVNSFPFRKPSIAARSFCKAGGVGRAIKDKIESLVEAAKELSEDEKKRLKGLNFSAADGLVNCIKILKLAEAGKANADFIEGMACEGGCIGGPGTLVNTRVAARVLDRLMSQEDEKDRACR